MVKQTLRIKICCIANPGEAETAIRSGASAIGLVSEMPSGPGVIPEHTIAEIAAAIPPGISTFLLTSTRDTEAIAAQVRSCRTNTVQIVDRISSGSFADLRRSIPGVRIVQVVHITGEESIREARSLAREVDALLLDSGKPAIAVKELGGTGRVHDWNISRQIVASVDVPVFLAGGLTPLNVAEAVSAVRPYGVDVCSGVRTNGCLDEKKLREFIDNARAAL